MSEYAYKGKKLHEVMPKQFSLLKWPKRWDHQMQVECHKCGGHFMVMPYSLIRRPVCKICLNGRFEKGSTLWKMRQFREDLGGGNRLLGKRTNYSSTYIQKCMTGDVPMPEPLIEFYEKAEKESKND